MSFGGHEGKETGGGGKDFKKKKWWRLLNRMGNTSWGDKLKFMKKINFSRVSLPLLSTFEESKKDVTNQHQKRGKKQKRGSGTKGGVGFGGVIEGEGAS